MPYPITGYKPGNDNPAPAVPGPQGQPGAPGKDGVGVSGSQVMYQAGTDGVTPPTTGWSADIPSVPNGQFLWTRTITRFTDGKEATAYSVAYIAVDGAPGQPGKDGQPGEPGSPGRPGVGIKSAEIAYQTGLSAAEPPTSGWVDTIPPLSKNQYLWARTLTSYTDGSSSVAYSLGYIGADGEPGAPGAAGVGVSGAAVTYQTSASGATAPTGSWLSTPPTPVKGQYLWTRTVTSYTNGTTTTAYSVAYNALDGSPGAPGTPGSPGTPGANGISYTPQAPVSRTVTLATPYQHTDAIKPYRVTVNARATSQVTLLALGQQDRVELRIGPTAASVALNAAGGFVIGVWETGVAGIAVTVGVSLQDGGQLTADVPAGWYFAVNRQSGTTATIVNCFTQSLTP